MKFNKNASSQLRHAQVRLLLPWYVNATLPKDERRLVEEHCQVCALCRAEQAEMQKLTMPQSKSGTQGDPS